MEAQMLKVRELSERISKEADKHKLKALLENKHSIQGQIAEMQRERERAKQEYLKERDQVESAIQRLVEEDREMARAKNEKTLQVQADMILSQNEKRALIQRQREIEQFENEMVRKYAEEQETRQN